MQTIIIASGVAFPSLYLCQMGNEYIVAIIWLGLIAYAFLWTTKVISEMPEYQMVQEARVARGIAPNSRWGILKYILSRR